jgi:hypothetical protein
VRPFCFKATNHFCLFVWSQPCCYSTLDIGGIRAQPLCWELVVAGLCKVCHFDSHNILTKTLHKDMLLLVAVHSHRIKKKDFPPYPPHPVQPPVGWPSESDGRFYSLLGCGFQRCVSIHLIPLSYSLTAL